MAIVLDETSAFESMLNYALFAGAIFQLICIFAVIFVPHSEEEKSDVTSSSVQGNQLLLQSSVKSSHETSSRRGKKEKKKHR